METRVLALMKSVERTRNPDAIQVRPGRKSRKLGSGKGSSKDLTAGLNDKKARGKAAKTASAEMSDEAREIHQVRPTNPAPSCQLARATPGRCLRHHGRLFRRHCASRESAVARGM